MTNHQIMRKQETVGMKRGKEVRVLGDIQTLDINSHFQGDELCIVD